MCKIILNLTFIQGQTGRTDKNNKMFDDFRNYLSNAHQVCCEDSPTTGLYDHCRSDDLDLYSKSQVRQTLLLFYLHGISDKAIVFKLGI